VSHRPHAVASECDRLIALADAMPAVVERRRTVVAGWYERLFALTRSEGRESTVGERALDTLEAQLRRAWMATAHEYADVTYRSPLAKTKKTLPSQTEFAFGYERSLETNPLEPRLDAYHPVPSDWCARHLLFSSGMAALSGIVQALPRIVGPRAGVPALLAASAYYETLDLLALGTHGAHVRVVNDDAAFARARADLPPDIALLEPIVYDPWLRPFDVAGAVRALAAAHEPPVVVVDSTLVGPSLPIVRMLDDVRGIPLVIQVSSGLKLDQAGLELANVGIVSLYAPRERARALASAADELVRVRRLNGTALTFDAVALLDVPFFLDPATFYEHSSAVFAHNARLARAIPTGGSVATVAHPCFDPRGLPWAQAPFVFVHLCDDTPEAHIALETLVLDLARRRGLALDRGGSFGFRGHRCEAIVLEGTARRAVFKLALGARAGPSLDGIIALMRDIATFPSVAAARAALLPGA
jgi:hypothetical protein